MTPFKKIAVSTLLMGAMVASVAAVAESRPGGGDCDDRRGYGGPGHHGEMFGERHGSQRWLGRMTAKLDLSDSQQAQVREVLDQARKDARALKDEMRANMLAEREAAESGASGKSLKKLAHKTADSRVELMMFAHSVEEKVRAKLTEQQNRELDALKATRKAHREERMKHWKERRDGQ